KSLMRDYSAFYLGGLLPGMYWSPFADFVHLYVNGEYMGVYMLTDERDVGEGRAQLTADTNPAVSEYLLELDWRLYRNNAVEGVDYLRVNTSPEGPREGEVESSARAGVLRRDHLYEIRYPNDDILTPAHFDYVRDYLTNVGHALRAGDMETIERLVDIDSLIDFYLVQELYQNVDAGFSSMFYQIKGQGEDRRIALGPLWDFDVAAGNADWLNNQTPYGLYVSDRWYWGRALHETPALRSRMVQRWNDIFVPAVNEMLAHIHQRALDYQAAFERNFERFDIMGVYVWPNPPAVVEIDTFIGQVDYLIDFLTRRMDNLSEIFNQ
ncbi:MAG: CotH kinase family protein, partial [Defluviitaleaceae bacterium]|nr:CotH kinase family protein [Defluviitaleaceae bacterium]